MSAVSSTDISTSTRRRMKPLRLSGQKDRGPKSWSVFSRESSPTERRPSGRPATPRSRPTRSATGWAGKGALIEASGSDSPLRFTGTVIRRVARQFPEAYRETGVIQLISSFIPAVLCGDAGVPWDFGNGCGTSLMDYRQREFSPELLEAVGGDLPGGAEALRSEAAGAHPSREGGRPYGGLFCREVRILPGLRRPCRIG